MGASPRGLAWGIGGLVALLALLVIPLFPPRTAVMHAPAELTTPALSYGFFPSQNDETGARYVWSEPRAVTAFAHIGNRPFDLILTVRSAAVAGGPDAPLHILVNDSEIAQLRLDPGSPTYQTMRVPVSRVPGGEAAITLRAEPFSPNGDRRVLGVIVRSVTVDQSRAWAGISDRRWLYAALPLLGALAAACVLVLRWVRAARGAPAAWAVALPYLGVAACLISAALMLVAVAILLRIGVIDSYHSLLWLYASCYLAAFCAVAAVDLPVWSPGDRSLWEMARQAAFVRRRRTLVMALVHSALFASVTLVALRFLASPGTGDVDDKLRWMRNIKAHGLIGGFQISVDDYPPGTYVVLDCITKIAPHLHMGTFLGYKLTIFLFLLLSSLVCWLWTRNAPLTIALQLALTVDSTALGYNDVYFVPTLLLALWALKARRPVWFSVLFTLTCLMKWQPLILVPLLLLYALLTMTTAEQRRRDVLRLAAAVVLPAALILAPTFAMFGPEFVYEFRRATTENFLSANALNFHWIVTHLLAWWDPQRFTFGTDTHRQFIRVTSPALLSAIKLLFAALYLGIIVRFARGRHTFAALLHFAYAGYLAYFLFNTSVHENHLVPAVILGGLLWATNRRYGPTFLVTAVVLNLNLFLFYRIDGVARLPVHIGRIDIPLLFSVLDVALFVLFLARGERLIAPVGGPATETVPVAEAAWDGALVEPEPAVTGS